jgi:hypothetical protein
VLSSSFDFAQDILEKPFVLRLSKDERFNFSPFDRLRVNGPSLTEQHPA